MIETADPKMAELKNFMQEMQKKEHAESYLIAILHRAQSLYGYLDRAVMDEIAQNMEIPTAHIWGVATFYHYFKLKPQGKHSVSLCLGTACFVKGAEEILTAVQQELGVDFGETTEDKLFTLQETRCLGACGLAPVMMIDDKVYGELTPKKATDVLKKYRKEEAAAA